jgi:hypothetical protein
MSPKIPKLIMWIGWVALTATSFLMAIVLAKGLHDTNKFDRPLGTANVAVFLFHICICGVLRYWIPRIRNPWFALIPYLLGVVVAQQAGLYGAFFGFEMFIVFQVVSTAVLLIYLPPFIKRVPPPSVQPTPRSKPATRRKNRS